LQAARSECSRLRGEVERWEAIAERDHGAPIATVEQLSSDLARVTAERDRYAKLLNEWPEAQRIERDTAAAIASWIERDAAELGKQAEIEPRPTLADEYRDMAQALGDLVSAIRAHAWRTR
jgi:hypothetical protein